MPLFVFCDDFTPAVAAGVVDGTSATTAPTINAKHKHAIATRAIVFFSFFVVVVVVGWFVWMVGCGKDSGLRAGTARVGL